MEDLVRSRPGLTLRKIKLPRGPSDVAGQYKIRSVPHLMLYEQGRLVANGTQAVLQRVQ